MDQSFNFSNINTGKAGFVVNKNKTPTSQELLENDENHQQTLFRPLEQILFISLISQWRTKLKMSKNPKSANLIVFVLKR